MSKYENILLDAPQAGTSGVTLSDAASKEPAQSQHALEQEKKEDYEAKADTYFAGKSVCPESLQNKIKDFLEFQRTCDEKIVALLPENVPQQTGLIFTNKGKIKKIVAKNAKKEKEKQELLAKKKAMTEELIKEKIACNAEGKFFFEYPDTSDKTTYRYITDKRTPEGFSIYRFGITNEEDYFTKEQGYKGIVSSHWSRTGCFSELKLIICDGEKLVNKEYPEGKNETLYVDGHKNNRLFSGKLLCQLLRDERYLPLYCDREYLKNNQNEKYTVEYMMDIEARYTRFLGEGQSIEMNMMSLYLGMPELSDTFFGLKNGGNKYKKFRDVFVKEIKEVKGNSTAKDFSKMEEENHLYMQERYMKRGFVVWHDKKIIAIFIPKRTANINVVIGPHVQKCMEGKSVYLKKVNQIEIEPGPNWEYYVATTIDYVATKLTQYLSVGIDVTEQKPEGLPDDLWSLWIRMRYENFVKSGKK